MICKNTIGLKNMCTGVIALMFSEFEQCTAPKSRPISREPIHPIACFSHGNTAVNRVLGPSCCIGLPSESF